MNTNTPLVNLALLEAMKGQRITDEIDVFIPYLALSICKIENESFDIQDVKEGVLIIIRSDIFQFSNNQNQFVSSR